MIKLMFMDERFAHPSEAPVLRATVLTGLVTDPYNHAEFRDEFYSLVQRTIGATAGIIPRLPEIHGMNLFPESDDEQRIAFLEGLAALAVRLKFSLYRIGYRGNRHKITSNNDERQVLPLCFMSMQFCMQQIENDAMIWPVMELARAHKDQDEHFPGSSQRLDWYSSLIGKKNMSVDQDRFGEVLYHTKQSAYGAMVDCFSYLLHLRFRRSVGEELTSFKDKLADIAGFLNPIVRHDEIIDLQWNEPERA